MVLTEGSFLDKVIINDLDEKGIERYKKFPTKLFISPIKKDIDFESDNLLNHIMKTTRVLDYIKENESEPISN